MSRIYSLDIETLASAPLSIKGLRQRDYERMSEEIQKDRDLPKEERQYIDKRLTDPAKIAAAIQKKLSEGASLDHPKDSLNPLTAEPICVVCIPMNESKLLNWTNEGLEENVGGCQFTDMGEFYQWASLQVDQFLGFNIDQFDIPCLRVHQARITSGIVPRVRAFWSQSIDLRREFGDIYNKGETYSTPRNLRYYTASILNKEAQQDGVVKEYLESDFTGADVAAAYMEEGGMNKIIHHCTLDALMAAMIAVKMGVYQ